MEAVKIDPKNKAAIDLVMTVSAIEMGGWGALGTKGIEMGSKGMEIWGDEVLHRQ